MITDDPGTPGDKNWEINLAWTEQAVPGSTLIGLPLLDANYGVGDRIQLNYQESWNLLQEAGAPGESGISDSQLAVKWRFYDAGEDDLQVSTYPRCTFLDPGSDSDRRGTAGSTATFLVPFEVRRNLGVVSVNVEFGHAFSAAGAERGWIGGFCLGRDLAKGWELDAEVHFAGSDRLQRAESTANLGTRFDFTKHNSLLLAVGRDIGNTLGPRISLLSYAGVQTRF